MLAIDLSDKSKNHFVIDCPNNWQIIVNYNEELNWHGWLIDPHQQKIHTEISEDSFETCYCCLQQEINLIKHPELIEAFQLAVKNL